MAEEMRGKRESHWIHNLGCIAPQGLNLRDTQEQEKETLFEASTHRLLLLPPSLPLVEHLYLGGNLTCPIPTPRLGLLASSNNFIFQAPGLVYLTVTVYSWAFPSFIRRTVHRGCVGCFHNQHHHH